MGGSTKKKRGTKKGSTKKITKRGSKNGSTKKITKNGSKKGSRKNIPKGGSKIKRGSKKGSKQITKKPKIARGLARALKDPTYDTNNIDNTEDIRQFDDNENDIPSRNNNDNAYMI
jgi:hypothetical protein